MNGLSCTDNIIIAPRVVMNYGFGVQRKLKRKQMIYGVIVRFLLRFEEKQSSINLLQFHQ